MLFIAALCCVSLLPLVSKSATAANFSMEEGYYVGTGASKTISGLGFQPSTVLIKASTTAGVMVFKTSAMPAANTAFMSATADNTATQITFTSNGFTIGTLANVNTANVVYYWTAFAGSDCSSTGNYCVGTFTGTGTATRTITTGFQPALVIAKRSTAVAANYRTASMAANNTHFFTSTAVDTTGVYIRSFAATGFDVGLTDNTSSGVYYYIAFKAGSSVMAEGTYTGDGLDNRNITGLGFVPSFVLIKNATSATVNNRRSVYSQTSHKGDDASYVGDAVADSVNFIQALQSDGFQIGSGVNTNESAATFFWFAFGGAPAPPAASGTFSVNTGTYTGTGATLTITGLTYSPDLVIIKDNSTNLAVFRTKLMAGDTTAHMSGATADFTGGITSLDSNGFTLGTSTITNTVGAVYQWQAFGNAYNPYTNSGAADFAIGAYYGSGIDNRNITDLPYQPDMVAMKRNSTTAAVWRSSANVGDLSSFFGATAETADFIQSLTASGFQVGTNAGVNASAGVYRWFAFKEGSNFDVGSYTGNGVVDRSITTPNFRPVLVWIKNATAVNAVSRGSSLAGDVSQYFAAVANAAGRIKSFINTGFTLGTNTEVNTNAVNYKYAAWRDPNAGFLSFDIVDAGNSSVLTPSYAMPATGFLFSCSNTTGTLGSSTQKLHTSNMSLSPAWTVSIAATDGSTALWRNGGNTQQFDFNDTTSSGCSDGADADSVAGKLTIDPSVATLTPQGGCSNSNLSLGSSSTFNEGVTNAITLLSASSSAQTLCYWDLTNIGLDQVIPANQASDTYTLNLTVTATAQ